MAVNATCSKTAAYSADKFYDGIKLFRRHGTCTVLAGNMTQATINKRYTTSALHVMVQV
jgi:hypothetical protein